MRTAYEAVLQDRRIPAFAKAAPSNEELDGTLATTLEH